MPSSSPEQPPRWLTQEEQLVWVALFSACFRLPAALDAQLQRDARLGLFEYMVLSRLSMAPGRTLRMSELASLASGSLSRLSNVVKRVEQRGWVRRCPDPEDGRFTLATLTDSGYAQVEAAAPAHVTKVASLVFDDVSADELAVLRRVCERITARITGSGGEAAATDDAPAVGDGLAEC